MSAYHEWVGASHPRHLDCVLVMSCTPASLRCKADRVVGDDSPDEGLHKGDGQAHDGGGNHKGPAGKEQVIALLEEDVHAIDLHSHSVWTDKSKTVSTLTVHSWQALS